MDDLNTIANLLAEYSLAVSDRRWDDWTSLFEPDGRLILRDREVAGHDALRPFIQTAHDGWGTSRPFVANLKLSLEGDEARVTSSFVLIRRRGEALRIASCGTYRDVIVRTADGWRFRRRVIEIDDQTGELDAAPGTDYWGQV